MGLFHWFARLKPYYKQSWLLIYIMYNASVLVYAEGDNHRRGDYYDHTYWFVLRLEHWIYRTGS